MSRRRRAVTAGLVGSVAAALFAWSLSVVTGTGDGRTLHVLCSTIETLCYRWAQGFTERTGIETVVVRVSSGEALARVSRPGGASEFDVWHGGPADVYVLAAERGLLQPYVSPEADAVPAAYKDPAGRWTGTYLGVLGFCSNRRLLDQRGLDAPTSWDDLLAPPLEHLVSVPSPVTSGTGYVWLWTQVLRLADEDAALAYVNALDRNVLQYTTSGMAPAGIVGRGEAAVAVVFSQHCVRARDAGMRDLVLTFPTQGSGIEIGSVAILAGAPHLDAARRYVDWALSKEAQSGDGGRPAEQLPTRIDVAGDPRLSGGRVLASTPEQAAAAREELTDRFREAGHR
ncbi:MAG: ABC transporter substrate-binding protein [Propionibacteriaceae bacterium]|nr:ABC transporter substrate-binding protein [Propionibacteriaceae bacterium]